MSTPVLSVSYISKEEDYHRQVPISTERRLKQYYLNLYRTQNKEFQSRNGNGINCDIDTSDDEEEVDIYKDSNSIAESEVDQFYYNKISSPKDYSKKYLKSHKLWVPKANSVSLIDSINNYGHRSAGEQLFSLNNQESPNIVDEAKFLNYLHLPKTMGPAPIPPLIYHTACEVKDNIFLLGGASTFFQQNGDIKDLSSYIVDGVNLPKPLNSRLLNNPTVIPNNDLYIISSETNLVTKPDISGDIPPPLLSMSASKITKRHIFYYGGFEIINKVDYNHGKNKIYIKKSVRLNNSAYVLDTVTMKFQKFELIAHPNLITKYPITVPRFGHSSCSINLSKHVRTDTGNNIAATVFIMGGFRQDPSDPSLFKAIKDLWKVELSITYNGKHDYVKFGESVLATPIPGPLDDTAIPSARAFHTAEIFDSRFVHGAKSQPEKNVYNPHKIGIARPSSPTASVLSNSSSLNKPKEESIDLKLIIHGGTDGFDVFGDVWWFDFDEEVWYPVSTYIHNYNQQSLPEATVREVQLKRTGHRGILIDKYLYILGGAVPSDFDYVENNQTENSLPDISSFASFLKSQAHSKNHKDDVYQRLFVLNLSTQTWLLVKYFHGIVPLIGTSKSETTFGTIGSTVTQCNSKVFVVGGQLIPHHEYQNTPESFNLNILNSCFSIFEIPLGSALTGSRKLN